MPIIAKIERPAAVDNLEAILNVADGVMVARGDLGLEMPLEQVPRVQKTDRPLRARALGRPVDPRDPGARIDARRAASDARRSQRRRQRGGRGGRRNHAGRGNRRRRLPGQGGADARGNHSGCRVAAARRACVADARAHRHPPQPRSLRGGADAGVGWRRGCHRRRHA